MLDTPCWTITFTIASSSSSGLILLMRFIFFPGFTESVMIVCCLFFWSAQLVCSRVMPASVGDWDNWLSWGKEGQRRRSLLSLGDQVRGGRETAVDFLLQNWSWNWQNWITRAVEEVWFCFQPLGTRGLWVSSGWTKLLRLASGTEQQIGEEVRRGLCVIQERWEGQRRHLRCSWGLELGERDRDRKEVCSTWFSGRWWPVG